MLNRSLTPSLTVTIGHHTRLYFAAQRIFRSDDRGDTWRPVSGDLTRQTDRNKLKVMGRVYSVDAVAKNEAGDAQVEQSVARRVSELCNKFPIYP